MKKVTLIKFICLGLIIVFFTGCWSEQNKQGIESEDWFGSVDKMLGVNEKNYINLEGNWRFSIGDDSKWALPDFNDNNWEKIRVPGTWEDQGFQGYNGYAWYRKTFKVPKELLGRNFILNGGFIDDVDQTFINGKPVGMSGGFPPQYVTAYDAHRQYYIPKEILREGENIIAIRVFDNQLEGGITRGAVGLSPTKPDPRYIGYLDLDINLKGMWKFKTGDENEWKNFDFNDTEWREVFVPAFWEAQGYKNYNGFAWYRLKFILPEKYADQKMVLLLGKIDDIDQSFVNGILVGSIGDWNFDIVPQSYNDNNEWETIRGYYIPENVLLAGEENTIAVRVFDGFMDGGIYEGPIGLITQEKYRGYWSKQNN